MLPNFGGPAITFAAFLVTVGIVVVVHEFGHYLIARVNGIRVRVFSIGFGREIVSWRDRNQTLWKIGIIPLGGYVAFHEHDARDRNSKGVRRRSTDTGASDGTFTNAALRGRVLTVVAGPVANFLLSIAVFSAIAAIVGFPDNRAEISSLRPLPGPSLDFEVGDTIVGINGEPIQDLASLYRYAGEASPDGEFRYLVKRGDEEIEILGPFPMPPIMEDVRPLSAASEAGLAGGDVVLAVDGIQISSFTEFRDFVLASDGRRLSLDVWRGGEILNIELAARYEDVPAVGGGFERRLMVGVTSGLFFEPQDYIPTPFEAIWIGTVRTFSILTLSVEGLANIVLGSISVCNIQGPISIAKLSGDAASQGLVEFFTLLGVLSAIIGFMNLLPIPILDGGHLLFFAYEAVSGRPPGERVRRIATQLGLLLVLSLLVLGVFNDFTCP